MCVCVCVCVGGGGGVFVCVLFVVCLLFWGVFLVCCGPFSFFFFSVIMTIFRIFNKQFLNYRKVTFPLRYFYM